jgi:hypothetical protein
VHHPEGLGNARQYPSIWWDKFGNTRKYSEILGNAWKYPEILGNTRKQGVLPVRFAAPLYTPVVFPCVPLTWKCSTISLNSLRKTHKYSAILGNARKYSEIPGNTRKYSETRGSAYALRCTPVYPCVPLVHVRSGSDRNWFMSDPVPVGTGSCRIRVRPELVHVGSGSGRNWFMSDPVPTETGSCRIRFRP